MNLLESMIDAGCVGFIESHKVEKWKTFKSGIKSQIYLDLRRLWGAAETRQPFILWLREQVRAIMELPQLQKVTVVGMATGSIAPAAIVAQLLELQFRYVRSDAKDHGTRQMIEGGRVEGHDVIFIEDVITLGESSVPAMKALRAAGARVVGCLAIFTYGFPYTFRRFAEEDIPLTAAVQFNELLSLMLARHLVSEADVRYLSSEWLANPPMAEGRTRPW